MTPDRKELLFSTQLWRSSFQQHSNVADLSWTLLDGMVFHVSRRQAKAQTKYLGRQESLNWNSWNCSSQHSKDCRNNLPGELWGHFNVVMLNFPYKAHSYKTPSDKIFFQLGKGRRCDVSKVLFRVIPAKHIVFHKSERVWNLKTNLRKTFINTCCCSNNIIIV